MVNKDNNGRELNFDPLANLPGDLFDHLRNERRWLCHGKRPYDASDKIPVAVCGPDAGQVGVKAAEVSSKLGTYAQAQDVWRANARDIASGKIGRGKNDVTITGLGIYLCDGLAGIDIDHCIDDNGNWSPLAQEIVDAMQTYTELSPSGEGLHLLFRVSDALPDHVNQHGTLEYYDSGRYFTFTGNAIGDKPVADRTDTVTDILARYLPPKTATTQPGGAPVNPPAAPVKQVSLQLTDDQIIDIISRAANANKFAQLYSGDTSAYHSVSEAEQAFCNILAFYTQDRAQIDRMYRASALYTVARLQHPKGHRRSLWDQRGHYATGETYGEHTIAKALAMCTNHYTGAREDPAITFAQYTGKQTKEGEQTKAGEGPLQPVDPSTYQSEFARNIDNFRRYSNRKSGFANLDMHTAMYPGLYTLGAVTSLGKTTFALQLADQLAASGSHVLYFSIEQTFFELVSKSIARIMFGAQASACGALPAIQIRRGDGLQGAYKTLYDDAWNVYMHTVVTNDNGGAMRIYPCSTQLTYTDVIAAVDAYIAGNNLDTPPVVIVDYLQALKPMDPRQTPRDAADTALRAFKDHQKLLDAMYLVISSFNRMSYLSPVGLESFKESGGIEYTCDVVWGLDPAIMHNVRDQYNDGKKEVSYDAYFKNDGNWGHKAAILDAAMREQPRTVVLRCLKNRFGTRYACAYDYHSKFDTFAPCSTDFMEQLLSAQTGGPSPVRT